MSTAAILLLLSCFGPAQDAGGNESPPVDISAVENPADDAPVGDASPPQEPSSAPPPAPRPADTEDRASPPPDRRDEDEDDDGEDGWSPVCSGGVAGCAAGGIVPAAGSVTGLGLFYGSLTPIIRGCGELALVSGICAALSGAAIAMPSLLLLGPCAASGAACGAGIGATVSGKDVLHALLWSLPGVGVGLVGGVIATTGILVTTSTEPGLRDIAAPAGTTLVVLGTLAALSAGPLAIAGATFTERDGEDDKKAADVRGGGIEAHLGLSAPVRVARAPSGAPAMVW